MSIRKRSCTASAVFETLHPRTLMSADPSWGYAYASTDYSIGPNPISLYARVNNPAAAGATVRFILSSDNQVGNADDIVLASAPASLDVHVDPTLPDLPAGTYHFFATCDNAYPTAAGDLTVYVNPEGPDLAPAPDPYLFSGLPSTFPVGEFHGVGVSVMNAGKTAAPSVTVALYLSPTPTLSPDAYLVQKRTVYGTGIGGMPGPGIDARGTANAIFMTNFPYPMTPGTYYPIAVIDPDNEVAEADESNNVVVGNAVTVTAPQTDLALVSVSTAPTITMDGPFASYGAGQVPLDVTVRTSGAGVYTRLSLFLSSDDVAGNADDIFVGFSDSLNIPATESPATLTYHMSATFNFRATGAFVPTGSYRLVAQVEDWRDASPGDNALVGATIAIALPAAPTADGPDLTIPWVSVADGTTARPDGDYWSDLDLPFFNAGNAPSGPFGVKVYLSADGTLDPTDTLVLSVPSGSYAPGQVSSPLRVKFPLGLSGTWRLIAVADADGQVAETNESNNVAVSDPFVLSGSPPYVNHVNPPVESETGSPTSAAFATGEIVVPGVASRTSVTLGNSSGSAFRGKYDVAFYLSSDAKLSRHDRLFSKRAIAATVPGHGEKSLNLQYTLPKNAPFGTQYLIVVATPHGSGAAADGRAALSASRRAQSVSRITVVGQHLSAAVVSTKPGPKAGTSRVTVRVTNDGTSPIATDATIRLLAGGEDSVLFTADKALNLKAGKHVDYTFTVRGKLPTNLRATVR